MAKRFTDSAKWEDSWFLELPDKFKLLWIYLVDKCNHAGIWKVNKRLTEFCLGDIDWEGFLRTCGDRIQVLAPEKWFLRKFVYFQYGELSPNNRVHLSVINELKKEGAYKGLIRPFQRAQEQDKVQDKEKDKDKDVLEVKGESEREKKPFGEEGLVMLSAAEFEKLVARLGEKRTHDYIQRLENYIGSKGKRYKSHYHTILNWLGNDDSAEKLQSRVRGRKELYETAEKIREELRS